MHMGKEAIKRFPVGPGLLIISHNPTRSFFYANVSDLRNSALNALSGIKAKRYHCAKLNELSQDADVDIGFVFIETETKQKARELKHRLMRANYGNPLLLNTSDWPKVVGGYKITHKTTGKFYVGCGTDLASNVSHQFHILKYNKHSSPDFQKLWNEYPVREEYILEWMVCKSYDEAMEWKNIQTKLGGDLCLNHDRYSKSRYRGGVYTVTHEPTGIYYIGSTHNIGSRINNHRGTLERNQHRNPILQEAYNKQPHGLKFWYENTKDRKEAYKREQELLDKAINDPKCCNISRLAESTAAGIAHIKHIQKSKSELMKKWHRENPERAKSTTQAMMEARRKGVMWDGVEYTSLRKAWEANGKNWSLIYRRLKDPEDYDVYLLKEPKVRPTE